MSTSLASQTNRGRGKGKGKWGGERGRGKGVGDINTVKCQSSKRAVFFKKFRDAFKYLNSHHECGKA